METVEQLISFNHIQVQLSGGSPWGFTLKGGLEHGEPLIITKIEEGGKAEQCKKLRVGDELVNINGSALFGSRQEALILIKGSFRKLKIIVRRRSVPVIRPHSWHLAKPSTSESPPSLTPLHPGPHTLPWHSTADSSDLSIQWTQLSRHDSTDPSSSLGSMESLDPPNSQVYYDAQNSPVDPAIFNNKRDYDSQNSPVDPAIFNNKRDSAYSSFSASSNTSDYTVSLRPGEACSMENILQSLGPGGPVCRAYPCGDTSSIGRESGEVQAETGTSGLPLISKSLTRPRVRQPEANERPSSCCYEEERKEGRGDNGGEEEARRVSSPPQPPTRKDSFRATRGRSVITDVKDQRCISAPVGIPCLSGRQVKDERHKDDGNLQNTYGVPGVDCQNGYPTPCENTKTEGDLGNGKRVDNFKGDSLEQYYSLISRKKGSRMYRNIDVQESLPNPLHPPAPEKSCPSPSSLPPDTSIDLDPSGEPNHILPQNKHSSGLHRHSAPEQLLSQLHLLQFSNDLSENADPSSVLPSTSQWFHSPFHPTKENIERDLVNQDALLLQQNQGMWAGSRCSTPGSVDIARVGEVDEELVATAGTLLSPIQVQHPWGRSVSVPGSVEPSGGSELQEVNSNRGCEQDFAPLSAATSVDSLLVEIQRGGGDENEGEVLIKKPRGHRSSRSRRRSERFATNLRNEIQRKKAQLSKSKGPGCLLYDGETVEEEGPEPQDVQEEEVDKLDPPALEIRSQSGYASNDISLSVPTPGIQNRSLSDATIQIHQQAPLSPLPPTRDKDLEPSENQHQATDPSRTTERSDITMPSCRLGIQVIEEPAPAGKARRWRWTPEHKLQVEMESEHRGERVAGALGVPGRGRAASTSSSCSSSTTRFSRTDDCDILPFADRCKFFEETSRSMSVSNLPGLSSRRQRPDRHGRQPYPSTLENHGQAYGQGQAQRRYSYQGGIQQETHLSMNTTEAQRQSVRFNKESENVRREIKNRNKRRVRERDKRGKRQQRRGRVRGSGHFRWSSWLEPGNGKGWRRRGRRENKRRGLG
ncbi:hypothetical protein UPYG_G00235360 [Umbra pygmaea]|uniref:PDZ domain-containing protein n=1 Tax=Umbra pygmaea TaxID=75934 RepID=A0ABD0WYG3_UMBPY